MTNKEQLIHELEEVKNNLYWDTSMILEIICEQLSAKGINATFKGRTIYIDDQKVASITTYKEGKNLIAIDKYFIYEEKQPKNMTLQEWAAQDENDERKIIYEETPYGKLTSEDEVKHYQMNYLQACIVKSVELINNVWHIKLVEQN